jgi:proton-translocating NADH-quinone oxidoreductase chain L
VSDLMSAALGALFLPLIAALVTPAFRWIGLARFAYLPAVFAFAASSALSLFVLAAFLKLPTPVETSASLTWFSFGDPLASGLRLSVPFSIQLDPLSTMMLATVTFIATWIAVFSASYMAGDEGYVRYFSVMCLFVFSMCLLVLANNLILLLAGWEGVGLCSYLLVGYYYFKPSAAAAARKAFLVTRLGDAFFLAGIFLLWRSGGYHLEFAPLFEHLKNNPPNAGVALSTSLLIFCGAVGKSAQFPLYVWLPDAMEGPTPVSALIHAATMVTAGVYLLARNAPLFALSPHAQAIITTVGAITAILAAFIALAQNDLKRVLAYSTVSQLGYMFVALGCAGAITPSIAVAAAMFHLFTHAFFKACLFLGSGSVMHAMGNVIDMRKFGGLRQIMPVTHGTFLIGSLALAGIPPLAGFWSKDQILDAAHGSVNASRYGFVYQIAFLTALLTAGMTAFYTFRAYFLTFWGPEKIPAEAEGHAHESPRAMTVPLVVLAIGAVVAGFAVEPINHAFSHYLSKSPSLATADQVYARLTNRSVESHPHFNTTVAAMGTVAGSIGLAIAFALYRKGPAKLPAAIDPLRQLSQDKLYVDEIYGITAVKPAEIAATAARQTDGLVESIGKLIAYLPRIGGAVLRPLQNGLVQYYALGTVLGVGVFLALAVFRGLR